MSISSARPPAGAYGELLKTPAPQRGSAASSGAHIPSLPSLPEPPSSVPHSPHHSSPHHLSPPAFIRPYIRRNTGRCCFWAPTQRPEVCTGWEVPRPLMWPGRPPRGLGPLPQGGRCHQFLKSLSRSRLLSTDRATLPHWRVSRCGPGSTGISQGPQVTG